MALTNFTIASPSGGTWTIEDTNTASVGRYHDLSMLMEGSVTSLSTARPGCLPGPANSGTQIPNAWAQATTTGLNVVINRGAAVVERSVLAGSYLVAMQTAGTVTLATADPTNPRIDRIDLQVMDGSLGDNGGSSITRLIVTTGTAAGVPVSPAAPANSIPICEVHLPANTTTATLGMIFDKRRSAGFRGGTRLLLPGDSLTDPGFMSGEHRDTSTIAPVPTIDRWNSNTATWEPVLRFEGGSWHGTAGVVGGQNRSSQVTGIGTTEVQVLTTGSLSLAANTQYMLLLSVLITGMTGSAEVTAKIHDTNTAGTNLGECFVDNVGSGHGSGTAVGFFTTTAAVTKTFIAGVQTSTGTCVLNQPGSNLVCMVAGASGIIPSV